jgi:transcriptional regulator with XRE-family HTH domain
MLLHEAVKKARKDLRLSQKSLAEMAGIQRKQLATLETGGNITLATLRKVLVHLPNLETFSLDAVSATVLRQVPPEEQFQAVKTAFDLLGDAIRDLVTKVNDGQLPDESNLEALRRATDTFEKGLGYDDEDLRRKREQEDAERERRLAAYRGGAAAAFASIIELAQRKKSRARSKRVASET